MVLRTVPLCVKARGADQLGSAGAADFGILGLDAFPVDGRGWVWPTRPVCGLLNGDLGGSHDCRDPAAGMVGHRKGCIMPASCRPARLVILGLAVAAAGVLEVSILLGMGLDGFVDALRAEPRTVVSSMGLAAVLVAGPVAVAALIPRTWLGLACATVAVLAFSWIWYARLLMLMSRSATAAVGFLVGPPLALGLVGVVAGLEWLASWGRGRPSRGLGA